MSEQNRQVKKNFVFNILTLAANVAVGILYTPFLVKNLGIVAYGVVPLALIINQYVSVLTGSLTSALTRFYSIALQQNDIEKASKYISTSLIVILGIIAVLAVPMAFVVSHIDSIFTIPENLIGSAKSLFMFTLSSFALSLCSSVFNITLYAYNRLDYLNIIKIVRISFKLIFVVVLFIGLDKNIAYVGVANFLTEFLILCLSIYFFVTFTKGKVKIRLSLFDKSTLGALSAMASWVVVQQLGDTLLYRIDNVIVNKFWSTKESGILGAFTELGTYTMIIAGVVGSLFGPLILQAYAKNDHEAVKGMVLDRSVSVGVLVAVMIGVICGFSPIILKVWLGEEFVQYNPWLYLKLFLVPFYSAAGIFAFATRAWNKVRVPALWTIALGAVNFCFVWFVAYYGQDNLITVQVILGICLLFGVMQSYFLNGIVFATLYKGTLKTVLISSLKILFVLLSVCLLGYLATPVLLQLNAVLALSAIALLALGSLFLSFKLVLSKAQINSMVSLVYKK